MVFNSLTFGILFQCCLDYSFYDKYLALGVGDGQVASCAAVHGVTRSQT